MGKFHSTVGRRDFIKALGLAGVGIGAAASTAPVFHDLDELKQANGDSYNRWWIKERDAEDITTPVDWSLWDSWSQSKYPMPNLFAKVPFFRKTLRPKMQKALPGNTLRDHALIAGGGFNNDPPWDGPAEMGTWANIVGPATEGIVWDEGPEENLKTCRSALHFFGTPYVGALEVNDHMKKLLDGGTTVFDDSEKGWKDENGIYHVPNKCRWILVWATKQNPIQNTYGIAQDPNNSDKYSQLVMLGQASSGQGYSDTYRERYDMSNFLKVLGYQALQPPATATVPFSVFAGLGEQGRNTNLAQTDSGVSIRFTQHIFTDFPLAPTKPIDAGIVDFCRACGRCAKVCPSNSIMKDNDTMWEAANPANHPGYKGWKMNWSGCSEFGAPVLCMNCLGVCPLNHPEEASIHAVIRATIGNTSIFNGFFANMDELYNYGKPRDSQELVDWWSRDLKSWKYDTLHGFGTPTY